VPVSPPGSGSSEMTWGRAGGEWADVHRIVDGPLDGNEDVDERGERGAHRGEVAG
jgi:hypothetical protein